MSTHRYLIVDNRARNTAPDTDPCKHINGSDSSPFQYDVSLSDLSSGAIRCVESVHIKCVMMARPTTEDYVVLTMEPLMGNVMSLDSETNYGSCIILFDKDCVASICNKGDNIVGGRYAFDPSLSKLDRFRIKFKKLGGSLSDLDFRKTDGTLVSNWDRHAIVLEIVNNT